MATKENKAFVSGVIVFVLLASIMNVYNFSLAVSVFAGALAGIIVALIIYNKK